MPFIGFAALPLLRENMLRERLAKAKNDAVPQLMSEISKGIMKLQQEVHQYIDKRCDIICQNTECAYDQVLSGVKDDIDRQIQSRSKTEMEVQNDIKDLLEKKELLQRLGNFSK